VDEAVVGRTARSPIGRAPIGARRRICVLEYRTAPSPKLTAARVEMRLI